MSELSLGGPPNPFAGMTEQELQALREYAAAMAAVKPPELTLGSPAGNPGYSLAAAKYAPQHYDARTGRVTGGELISPAGPVWMGAEGGDTPEAKAAFEKWLADNAAARETGFSQLPGGTSVPKPPGSPASGTTDSSADPNAALRAFLQSLAGNAGNASPVALPQGTAAAQNTSTQYATPSYPGVDRPVYGNPGKKGLL